MSARDDSHHGCSSGGHDHESAQRCHPPAAAVDTVYGSTYVGEPDNGRRQKQQEHQRWHVPWCRRRSSPRRLPCGSHPDDPGCPPRKRSDKVKREDCIVHQPPASRNSLIGPRYGARRPRRNSAVSRPGVPRARAVRNARPSRSIASVSASFRTCQVGAARSTECCPHSAQYAPMSAAPQFRHVAARPTGPCLS